MIRSTRSGVKKGICVLLELAELISVYTYSYICAFSFIFPASSWGGWLSAIKSCCSSVGLWLGGPWSRGCVLTLPCCCPGVPTWLGLATATAEVICSISGQGFSEAGKGFSTRCLFPFCWLGVEDSDNRDTEWKEPGSLNSRQEGPVNMRV